MPSNDRITGPFDQHGDIRLRGFDDTLPKVVQDELLSGRLTENSEKVSDFLRSIKAERISVTWNRGNTSITLHVKLAASGDARIDVESGLKVRFEDA